MSDARNELDTLVGCASFNLNTLSITEISVDVELIPTNALQSLTMQPAPSTSLPRFTVPAWSTKRNFQLIKWWNRSQQVFLLTNFHRKNGSFSNFIRSMKKNIQIFSRSHQLSHGVNCRWSERDAVRSELSLDVLWIFWINWKMSTYNEWNLKQWRQFVLIFYWCFWMYEATLIAKHCVWSN